jgi:hypothetical protein
MCSKRGRLAGLKAPWTQAIFNPETQGRATERAGPLDCVASRGLRRAWNMELADIIVGAFVGVAAIIVTIVVANRNRNRASLDCYQLSDISLLASDAPVSPGKGLEVTYDSQPLKSPRMVDLKIVNTGNVPIHEADYHEPITVGFTDGSVIAGAIVDQRVPGIVSHILDHESDGAKQLSIRPRLLNADDWFTLRLLVDGQDGNVFANSRIVGAPPMRRFILPAREERRVYQFGFFVITVLAAGIAVISALLAPDRWDLWVGIVAFPFAWFALGQVMEMLIQRYQIRIRTVR